MTGLDGTTSAPLLGELLPIELMNTIWADRDGVHDALSEVAEVDSWLNAIATRLPAGIMRHRFAADDGVVERLRQLRDASRRLAAIATDDPRVAAASPVTDGEAAIGIINRVAAAAPSWPVLVGGADAPRLETRSIHPPEEAVVSMIADQAVRLFTGSDRPLLRACLAPGCVLYFTKNHPRREWCSPACGNRARVTRHYQRHHNQG